jgi:septal ring factor EnvC (AmiA/AmiB activator)
MRKFKYISFFLLFSICWTVPTQWTEGYAQTKSQPAQPARPKTPATTTKKTTPAATKKTTPTTKKTPQKPESISTLKDKQSKVKDEMKKIDESLSKTQLSTKQSLKQLEVLNSDITKRKTVIAQQNKEIAALDRQIAIMSEEVRKMEREYNLMKQKYVDLIYHAYLKNNSRSRLLFIMSASSFQESYRRFHYLQQFAAFRKQQAEEIEASRIKLLAKEEELRKIKSLSEIRLEQREKEKEQLLVEKGKQDDLVTSLQKKEKELKKALQEQQKIAEQLNKKIEELIAKEAREAEKRRQAEQAQAATKGGYAMTQEEKVVSTGFEKAKGTLPWPLKGKITGRFGTQPHPALKHIMTNNKGIYITASKGAEATAAYDGTVTQCFSIPGSNNAVIVRHGNYLTVYANLTKIHVSVGDNVTRGSKIGKIYEDTEDEGSTTLLFQIWKEKDLLNPEEWIQKNP